MKQSNYSLVLCAFIAISLPQREKVIPGDFYIASLEKEHQAGSVCILNSWKAYKAVVLEDERGVEGLAQTSRAVWKRSFQA